MAEQRRHKRFRLDRLQVNGQLTFATEVTLLDISTSGVSLKADRRLNMGGKYILRLEDRGRFVTLKGVVAWSRLSQGRKGIEGEVVPLYTAGMKFVELSKESVAGLMSFIEHHGRGDIPPGDRRVNVRFQITAPGAAILRYPVDYRVKTISLGGMLIESEYALEPESVIPMELSLQTGQVVNFPGRVVSCDATECAGTSCYESGVEFIDLTNEDREVISAFVDYLATSE